LSERFRQKNGVDSSRYYEWSGWSDWISSHLIQ
jgi:hypothetical protein